MQNTQAISEFVSSNLGNMQELANGDVKFHGKVEYQYNGKVLEFETTVRIARTTFEFGRVGLDENEDANSNFLHMEFSPDFQKYSYNPSDRQLSVVGSSPKMGGEYQVIITC